MRGVVLLVARHVGELGQGLELGEKALAPERQLVDVRILERVLVLAACDTTADRDVLQRLQIENDPFHIGELRAQPVDDLGRRRIALVMRFQPDEKAPGIGRRAAAASEGRAHRRNVGIALDHARERDMKASELLRRSVLTGLRETHDEAGVLRRHETLGNEHEHEARQRQRGEEDHQGCELVSQHDRKRAAIGVDQRGEPALNS
ncbi:MAG TPA: hypothetical protein VJ454_11680 [Steroidobacteraceae bacterium]|nr:hypothetical protein [Steroidobacteraceae bacterium]